MHKYYIFLLVLLGLTMVLPLSAQEQVQGRVKSIKDTSAILIYYLQAATPDAPGVVPEKFASKAAKLEENAREQEKNGNKELARNLRATAAALRTYREIEVKFTDGDADLLGAARQPLSAAKIGNKLRMDVSVDEMNGQQPVKVTLSKLAYQVGEREATVFTNRGKVNGKIYGQMICAVVALEQFTVGINGNNIQVANPNHYLFWQITLLKARELKANQPFVARVKKAANAGALQVKGITVFTNDADIPSPEELSELGL